MYGTQHRIEHRTGSRMGKGAKQQQKALKLAGLSTEQLESWARDYGVKVDAGDRCPPRYTPGISLVTLLSRRDKLLSELNPYADGILDKHRPANLPLEPPTFTLATVRNAIPAHCFKR